MKKYKSNILPESIEVGYIEIDSRSFSNGDVVEYYLLQDNPKMWITSRELHPDFWELIEEKNHYLLKQLKCIYMDLTI